MRKVRLSTGFELALDGDLLGVLEALYREVTLRHALQVSFEDMICSQPKQPLAENTFVSNAARHRHGFRTNLSRCSMFREW